MFAQAPAPRPPELLITRLEGTGGEAGSAPPPAQRATGLTSLPVTRLDDRPVAGDLDGPRRVTLTLAAPVPVRETLSLLVTGTPFSIVSADGVDGAFAGALKDLSMREALEAVLFPRDMDYDVQGTVIRVFPRKMETRLFDVNYLNLRRSGRRGLRSGTAVSGGDGPSAADTSTLADSDVLAEIGDGVRSLLSESGRMHLDRAAGLVQVTDFVDRLDQVGVYVEAVQVRVTRQVRIAARVLEVTLNSAAATSIDWTMAASRSGSTVRPGAARGAAGMRIDDFEALIRALGEQGTVRTIAAPQVIAMNNEPAVIRVGTQGVYFETGSEIDRNGSLERTSMPMAVLEGLTLTVTPQIAADGIVQLGVAPTYAEKTGESKSSRGDAFPVLHVNEVDTLVRVQDGDTVVISGLLQDRVKTTTGTGLAGFFGAQAHESVKSELVILLTPVVVTPSSASVVTGR
jgi:MSHA biogenesis protein MshL